MRVLVVEDEALLAATVVRALTEEGFRVTSVGDGTTGLEQGLTGEFDAIVLDIMLPGMNGYNVVRELRAAQVWTPILMLTAKDGEYDQADAFDFGADDYLTKPFSFVVLMARLRALGRRGASARPVILSCGDVQLDPLRRRVTVRDTELALTPREYGFLEFLMRRGEAAVSKSEILRGVWDEHYEGSENVVEVYAGYLRRKLEGSTARLVTVRGHGYRFEVSRTDAD
ncbi:MAG: response regulator transcription factor [Nakamurella sp.]